MKVYGNFTQAELDEAFNARGTAPDFDAVLRRYDEDSARVRARFTGKLGVAFGPSADETLDIFPAERPDAPIQLFIHGGYWRLLTRTENSFAAEALVPAGATVVVINYALAPRVTLDEIVRQCRASIAWTWKNARSFGADPDRLFISGHSAGGHLVGMMLATDWERDFGVPPDVVKGATAVSGLYDLRPVRKSFVNEWLKLDEAGAVRNNPLLNLPKRGCPLIMSYGERDTPEFRRQSDEYLAAWRAKGHPGVYVDMPGFHHFDVMNEIANPASALARAVFRQMGLGGR
ncbi:MAG TPA: alpha/beta hydrolase [Alphaproteobacteria bacterium]|nr:alpha/beta hydrolase [Alphaproteobacteria bacterium]